VVLLRRLGGRDWTAVGAEPHHDAAALPQVAGGWMVVAPVAAAAFASLCRSGNDRGGGEPLVAGTTRQLTCCRGEACAGTPDAGGAVEGLPNLAEARLVDLDSP
jgi:hypothetical protein